MPEIAAVLSANVLYYILWFGHVKQSQGGQSMCGRYLFTAEQSAEIQQIIQEVQERAGRKVKTGEIYPTDEAPVLRLDDGAVRPQLLTWGFPLNGKPIINARAESAEEKALFRTSVQLQRCVIPSSGFFEWDGEKQKYLFRLPAEPTLYMAGLYEERARQEYYCILTTAANHSMHSVHDRMPLILRRDQMDAWLQSAEEARRILRMVPPELEKTDVGMQQRLW